MMCPRCGKESPTPESPGLRSWCSECLTGQKTKVAETRRRALVLVNTLIETVQELDEPCPEGVLFACFMGEGVSLFGFQSLVRLALATGHIKRGPEHTLVAVEGVSDDN